MVGVYSADVSSEKAQNAIQSKSDMIGTGNYANTTTEVLWVEITFSSRSTKSNECTIHLDCIREILEGPLQLHNTALESIKSRKNITSPRC